MTIRELPPISLDRYGAWSVVTTTGMQTRHLLPGCYPGGDKIGVLSCLYFLTVYVDTSTPRDLDSNSSLNTPSADEAEIPTTHADHSVVSSSSSDPSRSAYYPVPRHHKLQIYLSGRRKTILPVAEPANLDARYLDLR